MDTMRGPNLRAAAGRGDMIRLLLGALVVTGAFVPATASDRGCVSSREYLLGGLAGELPQAPQSYKSLFQVCTAAADSYNIKDAYILKDGGIAVVAKRDDIPATAATLSDFCQRFPTATLRFINRAEQGRIKSVAQTVLLSSTSATPCRRIRGMPER